MRLYPTAIQRDLIKHHIGPFIFTFLTIMFLLLMQFLMLYIDKLVGKGIPTSIVLDLIFSNLAYMVVLAVPMAVLVSTLMAFGRFSELNELTALKAGGVSPLKIIIPLIYLSILLSLALAWFSNYVLPEANYRARSLFIDIRMKKPGFDLKPNTFYDGISGYTFLVKKINSETDSLYNVTLFQDQNKSHDFAVIKATRGYLKSEKDQETLTLYLFDGNVLRYLPTQVNDKKLVDATTFHKYRISFDLSDLAFSRSNPDRYSRDDRTMSAQAMMAVVDTLKHQITNARQRYDKNNSLLKLNYKKSEGRSASQYRDYHPNNGKIDSTKLAKPEKSKFVVLNNAKNLKDQQDIAIQSVQQLRQNLINFENLGVNLQWRERRRAEYMVEVHKKLSIPFGCIIFVLIGAPLGLLTRKGNLGYAALISAVTFTFYWLSLIQGEKLADRMYISPFTSMWFGNIVLGILGIILLIKIQKERLFRH
ncbi:MAG TPA: LptF/LptG family permease [Balneolales bacterium]|nr:LptF/LptG family permease [Balneolales bacterium]